MAIVIRTAYNNKDWKGACDYPGKEPACWACFTGFLQLKRPEEDDVVCSGDCWERRICTDYRWGCTPKGRTYGMGAYRGATAYLVFKQLSGSYTVWGKTKIRSTDKDYEDGFAYVHFEPFKPLPRDKWVSGLSDVRLVGARWLQGRHRYIDGNQERYLDQLIAGHTAQEDNRASGAVASVSKAGEVALGTLVNDKVFKELEDIALAEGRTVDELVREAIAEFVRNRQL